MTEDFFYKKCVICEKLHYYPFCLISTLTAATFAKDHRCAIFRNDPERAVHVLLRRVTCARASRPAPRGRHVHEHVGGRGPAFYRHVYGCRLVLVSRLGRQDVLPFRYA